MTAAAIAIPLSTVPAASAPQTADVSTSGEGFAAALAALLGVGANATPNHGAPVHAHGAKPQAAASATTQDNQVDLAATVTPVAGTIVPMPTPAVAPAAEAVTAAAGQIASAQAALAKGDKAQAQNATAAAAQAAAAGASDAAAPAQPQNAALMAQQLAATTANTAATNATTAPAAATSLKAAQKAAAAKQAPASSAPATDAQNQAASAKPEAAQQVAPAAQRSLSDGSNNGAPSDLPSAKIDTAASQAAAQPFVVNMQTTADAQAPAPSTVATAAVPLDALAVHIARKFESGESRFEIRLDPAGLGKLDISMTVDHDGRVQAVLRAERPETLDMLQRDARVLENQLRQSGLNVDSNSLNFSLGGGNGNRQAFGENSTPFARALNFAPEVETTKPATTIVSVRDGIDIRI